MYACVRGTAIGVHWRTSSLWGCTPVFACSITPVMFEQFLEAGGHGFEASADERLGQGAAHGKRLHQPRALDSATWAKTSQDGFQPDALRREVDRGFPASKWTRCRSFSFPAIASRQRQSDRTGTRRVAFAALGSSPFAQRNHDTLCLQVDPKDGFVDVDHFCPFPFQIVQAIVVPASDELIADQLF